MLDESLPPTIDVNRARVERSEVYWALELDAHGRPTRAHEVVDVRLLGSKVVDYRTKCGRTLSTYLHGCWVIKIGCYPIVERYVCCTTTPSESSAPSVPTLSSSTPMPTVATEAEGS